MTRLRNLALGSLAAALVVTGAASKSFAEEPGTFQNRLNGATIGLPLGALPPSAGIYSGIETAYLGWPGAGKGNQANGLFVPAIAQAVPILFVPGWNFFGASYAFSVVQAFYEFTVLAASPTTLPQAPLAWGAVVANTLWNPVTLSWNLGNGWFAALGFNFMAPDGSRWAGTPNPDYWTLEPTLAISYLANNWVLSANMFYDFNLSSRGVCCGLGAAPGAAAAAPGLGFVSGQMFFLDMTAAYKFGKWEVGPVAFVAAQTTNDQPGGGVPCGVGAASICGNYFNFALGALVGYDFGPVDLQVWFTDSVIRHNAIDGFDMWSRFGFKIWGPEPIAAKPLVAKN